MSLEISKASKFVLRLKCINDEEFGPGVFNSLDVAQGMSVAGHSLDYEATLQQLRTAGYIELVERAEDTGGLNYYIVTDRGRNVGYPEKYGKFDIKRLAAVSGPLSFLLTTLGLIGSPFAIANLVAKDWNWSNAVRYLIETYEVFRGPVDAVISKMGGALGIENVPTWFADYCVLGIIFWQAMNYATRLELEYNFWSYSQSARKSIPAVMFNKSTRFVIFLVLWPLLALWELATSAVLFKYYFNLDGFDPDTKTLHPRMALTFRFLGVILPLILFVLLWIISVDR